ncbi:MAG: TatD family hydrolase [Desulfobacterales bacterium]|nr:TatD family hydrolase [Desulfobacterales bacterium]MDJ0883143.1 TatD family hydrolase [Desulfobacterales bacterium]
METALLTDTHTHICDTVFDADREAVLVRAAAAGIGAVIAVGEDLADAKKNIALARDYPILKPAAGLYPTHLDRAAAAAMMDFIRAHRRMLAAIGEVGLDFWVVKTSEERNIQREIFTSFIDLALELDLPLNVHSRSAGRHTVELLLTHGARRVQMHAFDGKITAARPALEAGYYFSIPPSIVRSRQKQKLVRHLPLESLLVETDSPVLGPDPQARNEPANLMVAIDAIAAIKDLTRAAVSAAVAVNTQTLYGF